MPVDIKSLRVATKDEVLAYINTLRGRVSKKRIGPRAAKVVVESIGGDQSPEKESGLYRITSGISPAKIYIYLKARFGEPNGSMNLLKKNDSDNFFHWHYTLICGESKIEIMAMTYRIEVWSEKDLIPDEASASSFLGDLVRDSANHRESCAAVSSNLEKWNQIINPFNRLNNQIVKIRDRLDRM